MLTTTEVDNPSNISRGNTHLKVYLHEPSYLPFLIITPLVKIIQTTKIFSTKATYYETTAIPPYSIILVCDSNGIYLLKKRFKIICKFDTSLEEK